jgi:hypothetical protein
MVAIMHRQPKRGESTVKDFHQAVKAEVSNPHKEDSVSKSNPTPKQAAQEAASATSTLISTLSSYILDKVSPVEEEEREEVIKVAKRIWKKNKVRTFIEETQKELSEKKKKALVDSIADECDKASNQ